MPRWHVHSEAWMQRMIALLQDRIACVISDNAARSWNGIIPTVRLKSPHNVYIRKFLTWRNLQHWHRSYAKHKIGRIVNRLPNPVVFCQYLDYALTIRALFPKTKLAWVVHCHGVDFAWKGYSETPPFRRLHDDDYPRRVRGLAEQSIFIANSEFCRGQLLDIGVPEENIRLKYFGIDSPAEFDGKRNSDDNEPIRILFVGRLFDAKGPDLTIQAFVRACERGLNAELIMAGDGPLRVTCELLARRSPFPDKISILGWVEQDSVQKLYKDCDIFTAHNCRGTITHREEAFGVSILEAMAAGLPVITGRSGGVTESIVDGETGILFEPGDVDAHADALLLLASDGKTRERLGAAGWKRARENFSLDQERTTLLNILDECV